MSDKPSEGATGGARHPAALLSYSHDSPEHEQAVLDLCNRLRESGVDATLDQFLPGAPPEGWPLWMERQIARVDFVILVCTETYHVRFMDETGNEEGRGVVWEARLLRNLLYRDSDYHRRIVPIILSPGEAKSVPNLLKGHVHNVSTDRGFEDLVRYLFAIPKQTPSPLGPPPSSPAPQPSRWSAFEQPWRVPSGMRTPYFTGRQRVLELIREQLAKHQRTALCGLGGVGKSQAALRFAVDHRPSYPSGVFWVDAQTPSGLTGGFVEIAKVLQLTTAAASDQERAVRSTLDWLDQHKGWLLILDNVDDRRDIADFVPRNGSGHLLITSRESVFQEIGIARAIELGDLENSEARQFLLKRTGRETTDEAEGAAVADLAKELGNLPLALEQAGAYIAENNVAFADYLKSFRVRRVTLLERAKGLLVQETVSTTWSANFDAVMAASPAAADVLRLSAFLAPDAIPFELLAKGASGLGEFVSSAVPDADDVLAIGELLRSLSRYSLIRSDANLRTYSLHRLVQEVVREAMLESERTQWADRLSEALEAAFPDFQYPMWGSCDRLIPHVVVFSGWARAFGLESPQIGRLLNRAGIYLMERARYAEAGPLLEFAVRVRERILGETDLEVGESVNTLANLYRSRGKFAEAIPLSKRALEIRERALGPDDALIVMSLDNLALIYGEQGRYSDAQPLLERSLAMAERVLGREHISVAWVLNCLGWLYGELGRFSDARVHAQRALAIRERLLGPDHPDISDCLNVLAEICCKEKCYEEAQPLAERAAAMAEAALGPEHPAVAASLEVLARIRCDLGDYRGAIPLAQRTLAIRERLLGPDHPHVAFCLRIIADAYRMEGSNSLARPLYARALAISEISFDAGHPELAELRRHLGSIQDGELPSGR